MPSWVNADGLSVKYGSDEGDPLKGGLITGMDGIYRSEFTVDFTDARSATYTVLGNASAATDGAIGIQIPEGARIKAIETVVITPFTSSGTIGSANISMGLKKWSDQATELDHDGFTTTTFAGALFDSAGERQYVVPGGTGAGALIGTTLAEDGVVVVANTAHATHPLTAGRLNVRVEWFYP